MKSNFSSLSLKQVCLTILFYQLAAIVIYVLDKVSPTGSCALGLGVVNFMLLSVVSASLFVVNLVKIYRGEKTSTFSASIHFVFLVGFVTRWWWESHVS